MTDESAEGAARAGAAARRLVRRRIGVHRLPESLHPVAVRVLAGRGLCDGADLDGTLATLLPPAEMLGLAAAADRVVAAMRAGERIVIAGDYDADGATGVALGVLGLRALGARDVDYVVPHRVTMGYGLTPPLVAVAAGRGAKLLVTVDNGIASLAGVDAANALGIDVVVTDHHLPGPTLPAACAIVNPNQPGCAFASKHLAGVGVMFYLLLAVRARVRTAGGPSPNLADFLDLVALGTVADLVRLDHNNRVLVANGLMRIRARRARPGIRALLQVAGRDPARLTSTDLGFVLGPRINAAGRLDDIRIGIECLLCDDEPRALELAHQLDRINRERRSIQTQMDGEAQSYLADFDAGAAFGLCLFDPGWHEGVVGLVASGMKERHHRPSIAFARANEGGMLKGSARSIPGLHLRDVLAAIDASQPGLIERFGGHAMAAGLSLRESALEDFRSRFDAACRERLAPEALERVVETDGELSAVELQIRTALELEHLVPWGQGVPEPVFENEFDVLEASLLGADESHVRYRLRLPGGPILKAMDFGGAQRLRRGRVRAAYVLAINRWNDAESLELRVVHLEPVAG